MINCPRWHDNALTSWPEFHLLNQVIYCKQIWTINFSKNSSDTWSKAITLQFLKLRNFLSHSFFNIKHTYGAEFVKRNAYKEPLRRTVKKIREECNAAEIGKSKQPRERFIAFISNTSRKLNFTKSLFIIGR